MFFEILLIIFVILIFLYINFHEWPSVRTLKMMRKFPGPPEVFFFGHSLDLAKLKEEDVLNFFGKWCKEYGPVFKVWRLSIPSIVLTEPEDIEVVLSSTQHIKKGLAYERLKDWLNEGLLLSTGLKWKYRRKLLTPAFHFRILENCTDTFNKDSQMLINELLETNEKPIDIEPFISKFTLQVICETAMGIQLNNLPDSGNQYRKAIQKINKIIVKRIMSPLYLRDWVFYLSPLGHKQAETVKILHSFTDMVIEERRQLLKSRAKEEFIDGKKKQMPSTFLDCLLEVNDRDAKLLSLNDIREEVDTFMFEGHDTTSAAISACIFLIGHHSEVQERISEEIENIFGKSNREITMEDLHNLKYLECVIKESLRLFPSVPVILRRLESDMSIQNGKYKIPATASIIIFPYWLHRKPENFPEPEKFIPERFLSEEAITRHPFAYIPFSGGPRNCIGQRFAIMEMKIVLTTILRKARIQSVTRFEDIKMGGGLILRPNKPFKIRVIPKN